MPVYDFLCEKCADSFEAVSFYEERIAGVRSQRCPDCGQYGEVVWLKAPGMQGEENVSKQEIDAARMQLGVKVETRSQLNRVLKERGLVAVTKDEFDRGKSAVNTKKKFLNDELKKKLGERVRDNIEKAKSGVLVAGGAK